MRLNPARYDPLTNTWRLVDTALPVRAEHLGCATFNVWFSDLAFKRRAESLLDLLAACDVDVIALQEVTPRFLEQLLDADCVRAGYAISDHRGATVWPYGVLLLTRWTPQRLTLYPLPGEMGRKLLVAEWYLNGQRSAVATVHLESKRASAPTRAAQLARIFPILAPIPHALLMGDFNFCASWAAEQANLDPAYLDVWSALRPGEPGYTEDTAVNLMRLNDRGRHKQVRFDRVMVRSTTDGWAPTSIELLGDRPVGPDALELFPSDHFGLSARFAWRGNDREATAAEDGAASRS
jgi:tyrosyl-DNA phosphodiesterase 2